MFSYRRTRLTILGALLMFGLACSQAVADHIYYGEPDIDASWIGSVRWMEGFFCCETYFHSVDKGVNFLTSSVQESEYRQVILKLTSDPDSASICQTFTHPGFWASETGTFPGSAWDISDPASPRRLNICFAEWDKPGQAPPPNSIWDPDSSRYGKKEYVFIMNSDYDSVGAPYAGLNIFHDTLDVLYTWWPIVRAEYTFFQTESAALEITPVTVKRFKALGLETEVYLNWDQMDTIPQKYVVYSSPDYPPNDTLVVLPGTTTNYKHDNLAIGAEQYYKVEAYDTAGIMVGSSGKVLATTAILSSGMDLVGYWNRSSYYGDIWGYTDPGTGKEYALICVRQEGVSIVDITVTPPVEVGFAPTVSFNRGANDVKTYGHYLISITGGEPVSIFDISDVTNPVRVSTIPGPTAHNGFVDGDYLYLIGDGVNGLDIYDIGDPTAPFKVGEFQPYFYHDVAIHNDTLAAFALWDNAIDLIDVSDKANPQLIASFGYPGMGAHNGDFSEDGNFLFVGDEIGSAGTWTRVFDISDISNIAYVADMVVDSSAVVHNCFVKGDFLYISHYAYGVRVWLISDPTQPVEVAYYDIDPDADGSLQGCWGVYPYFESGKIIASSMEDGLFVLKLTEPEECFFQTPGDANSDGLVTQADADFLYDYVHSTGPAPDPLANGDVNGDCCINDDDIDHIVAGLDPVSCTCIEPQRCCCLGMSGNIDGDPADEITIADLTHLVSFLFGGNDYLSCVDETNINGDMVGSIDVSDLTYLVAYLFIGGPAPVPCP